MIRSRSTPLAALLLLIAAFGMALFTAGCAAEDAEPGGAEAAPWAGQKLRFGLLPAEDQQKVLQEARFLETYLEKELPGLDVVLFIGPAYAATIEAMKAGELEFAYFGPFSYFIAREVGAKVESALAFQTGDTPPRYYSVLYARQDAGITSLAQLKGREATVKWGFVDPGSTSGNLAPKYMLLRAGLNLKTIQANEIYAGGHDKAVLATNAGQVQVGAAFEGMLVDLCRAGRITGIKDTAGGGQFPGNCGNTESPNTLVTLAKLGLPGSPIAYRTDMNRELANAVIEALLVWHEKDPVGYGHFAEVTEGLDEGEASRLVRFGHENFEPIVSMCRTPELRDICPKR
jgi:phosphonate transport system substrate-binding protein